MKEKLSKEKTQVDKLMTREELIDFLELARLANGLSKEQKMKDFRLSLGCFAFPVKTMLRVRGKGHLVAKMKPEEKRRMLILLEKVEDNEDWFELPRDEQDKIVRELTILCQRHAVNGFE